MFVYIALLVGLGIWLRFRVRKAGFLPGFSTLLERRNRTAGASGSSFECGVALARHLDWQTSFAGVLGRRVQP